MRLRSILVAVGLYVAAAVVGTLVGWLVGDHSTREWVLSYGGSAELFGVLLIAAPELVPILHGAGSAVASAWTCARETARNAADTVRRWVGRPRNRTIRMGGTATVSATGSVSARVTVSAGTTLEDRVAFLLRREQEMQGRLEEITTTLNRHPEDWRGDIEAASEALRGEQADALRELRAEHLRERLLGLGLLLLGVVLATWGNLV